MDVGLGCLDCGFGLIALGIGRNICSLGCFEFVAPQVDHLLADVPPLDKHFATLIVCSCKIQVALSLRDQRDSYRQRLFCLQHLCLCTAQLSFGFG